jgi:light-regulated signal transduction histidine kinase (bacteriophytochrome)
MASRKKSDDSLDGMLERSKSVNFFKPLPAIKG